MPTPDSVLTRGQQRASRWLIGGVVVLAVDTAHLAFFSRADWLTALMVGLHIVLGVLIGVFLLVFAGIHLTTARRFPNRRRRRFGLLALVSLGVAVASGGALLWTGAFGPGRVVLAVHFASGVAGLGRNDTESADHHWLRIILRGTQSNRDAMGTKLVVKAGGLTQVDYRRSGSSYLSCSDPRLLFGLGRATEARLEVTWPSGSTQHFGGLLADRTLLITEGQDEAVVLR